MAKQYKLKGINDDYDTCEVCGKTNLKRVMWLVEISEDGDEITEAFPAGTMCGAKLLGLRLRSEAKVNRKIDEIAREQVAAAQRKIMDGFVKIGFMMVPPELVNDFNTGKITTEEMVAKKEEMYPILAQLNGRMTIQEAVKFS